MLRNLILIGLAATLIGCSGDAGNPFADPGEDGGAGGGDGGGGDDGAPIDAGPDLPPGTASPTPATGIFRREASDTSNGNGTAQDIRYDAGTDTFFVDNLAFDGNAGYGRDDQVGSLGPFAVYENANVVTDDFNGEPVGQFTHKALYGVSASGDTKFAIVRTGSYVGYGFGGFIYQREGGVTLPTSGQGNYAGQYAGLRDFNGRSGLEYTTADMAIAVDFGDFNDGQGVAGTISNRRIFDLAGTDITAGVIAAINAEYDASITAMPVIRFNVGPGLATANGEASGPVQSSFVDNNGETQILDQGTYYAILSGDNAEEIVGIVVSEAEEGRPQGTTTRESGGFIVYRDPADR